MSREPHRPTAADLYVFDARDAKATEALGRKLGELLPSGSVVALNGALGAGKTFLVQALAEANGVDRDEVVSPTFVLVNQYVGRRSIFHLDVYRLKDEDEFLELGPEEYFDSQGITLVEWAERVADLLPPQRLEVRIEVTGETSRRIRIAARGPQYEAVVSRLRQWGERPARG